MPITEEEARRILEPHEPRISRVMNRAWARLAAMPERASFTLKRCVATVMHQFMMNELLIEYGDGSVHLMEEHETIRLLIERRLVVRIKKMDRRGITRAYPTQAALALIDPNAPARLPFKTDEVPERTATVDMGYVLNDLETRIDHRLVAARDGDAVLWAYVFGNDVPMADVVLVPAVPRPSSPSTIIVVPDAGGEREKSRD